MLTCGGAVVASTAAALREVLGDRAWYIEPDDLAGWRDALIRIITDDDKNYELRRGTVEHGEAFQDAVLWPQDNDLAVALDMRGGAEVIVQHLTGNGDARPKIS